MDINNRRALKDQARQSLAGAAYDPRKLVLIQTGASALFTLVLMVLNFILDESIDDTAGLAGLQTRSILATIQTLLTYAQTILVPLWSVGMSWFALKLARGEAALPKDLTIGLRRFWPFLRLTILQTMLYGGVMLLGMILGSQLFLLTPLADPLILAVEADTQALTTGVMSDATVAVIDSLMGTMLLFCLPGAVLLLVPVFYRYRLAVYILLDFPRYGALYALRTSRFLTRKKAFQLFKLDLSFWWFYLLEAAAMSLAMLDLWLPVFGVTLPFPPLVSYFGFYVLGLAAQLSLYWFTRAQVEVTYAHAFERLHQPPEPARQVRYPGPYGM